jgi:tetratricopeptide (TPR) repeat protein
MPVSASYLFMLLGAGSLFLEPLPTPLLSPPPSDAKPADPKPDESTLPPRQDVPSLPSSPTQGKTGTIVEELALPPHEQSAGPIPILPPRRFREEAAPMPHEQTPTPPVCLRMPGASRDPSLPDIEALRRETESLRLEREAMLAEETELVAAKDFYAGTEPEANLQKRIAELLVRLAQPTKNANETAAAPLAAGSEKSVAANGQRPPAGGADLRADGLQQPTDAGHVPVVSPAQLPPPPIASVNEPEDTPKVVTDAPVDPLALAQSLFRVGDFTAALDAYRKLDKEDLKSEERAAIQYMTACCLRKLGKVDEASALYREVAHTPGNDFLSENAQWYLRTMKERRELEAQFEELRQRRQALNARKL